jgi:hypothetical protein
MSEYTIVKGTVPTRTTWRSGALQRGPGTRWFVERDGQRLYLVAGSATSGGGFFTRKAARFYVDRFLTRKDTP